MSSAFEQFRKALREHVLRYQRSDDKVPEFRYVIPANKLMELKADFEFAASALATGPVTCIFDNVKVRFDVTRAEHT
jgi:hypothetical protein